MPHVFRTLALVLHSEQGQNHIKRKKQLSVDTLKAVGWWYVAVLFDTIMAR